MPQKHLLARPCPSSWLPCLLGGPGNPKVSSGDAQSVGKRLSPLCHGRHVHSRLHSSSLHQCHVSLVLPDAFLSVVDLPSPNLGSVCLTSLDYFNVLIGLSLCKAIYLSLWCSLQAVSLHTQPSVSPEPASVAALGPLLSSDPRFSMPFLS